MRLLTVFLTFVLFASINISVLARNSWDYHELGPDVWKDLFPTCGSTSQSPININSQCTTYQSFPPFVFSDAYNLAQDFVMINDGHVINGKQVNASAFPLTLTGGGLNETFTFAGFHVHWGENFRSGSEHEVNGQRFSGEVHFVHANADRSRYAVLGFLMQTGPSQAVVDAITNETKRKKRLAKRQASSTDNSTVIQWQTYFGQASTLTDEGNTTVISLQLMGLFPTILSNFYRYSGSLTTPPCTENVIWTVFDTVLTFSQPIFDVVRKEVALEMHRDPQPLYGRTVYRSFVNATPSTIPDYTCCQGNTRSSRSVAVISTQNNANSILSMNSQLIICACLFLFSPFIF